MRIHFVYAGSVHDERIQSPYSITRNLYNFLKERVEVVYHQWDAGHDIDLQDDDILLGHPHYEHHTVVQRVFRQGRKCRARCLIHPLHHGRPEDNLPFDFMAKEADKIFSIMGPYWYDTLHESAFAHWKPKIVRVDMAVDVSHFPYLRQSFKPAGKRRLVFIGSAMPQKNLGYMAQIMSRMKHVQLDWYGGYSEHPLARQPNVHTVGWVVLDRNMAAKIINDCDIFINTSISDANPTTVLEACSWGLIPIISKESGYWPDGKMFDEIHLDMIDKSCENIEHLRHAPEAELLDRAAKARHIVETQFNWNKFCSTIWDGLQPYIN